MRTVADYGVSADACVLRGRKPMAKRRVRRARHQRRGMRALLGVMPIGAAYTCQ
jgi:hypothetical protein